MNTFHSTAPDRRFYRDADRAMLGGVCAGIAGYMGFNLRATRILTFIAVLMTMPVGLLVYLAIVFLVPSSSSGNHNIAATKKWRRKCRARAGEDTKTEPGAPTPADVIRRRCSELDERLARLEKHVTSKRFQLEQELRRL